MKTKKFKSIALASIFATFGMTVMSAQLATSVSNVKVGASLFNQMTLSKDKDVDFGGIFLPLNNQTAVVTMDSKGEISATNTTVYTGSGASAKQVGLLSMKFNAALGGKSVALKTEKIDLSNGVSKIGYEPALYSVLGGSKMGSDEANVKLDASLLNGQPIYVAGTLTIPGDTTPGVYTGTLTTNLYWQ